MGSAISAVSLRRSTWIISRRRCSGLILLIQLNPKLREFARHYGTVILPCLPKTPEHKGKVENSEHVHDRREYAIERRPLNATPPTSRTSVRSLHSGGA